MNQSATKLVIFLALLFLSLCSIYSASPILGSTTASQLLNVRGDLNNPTIVQREVLLEGRQEIEVTSSIQFYVGNTKSVVEMPICVTNYGNPNMCTVGYATNQAWKTSMLWVFDHNCVGIGYNPSVPWSDLAASPMGWSFSSQLPKYVMVKVTGNAWDGQDPNFNLDVWYGGGPAPGHTSPLLDQKFIHWAGENDNSGYFSFHAPFTC